MDDKLQIIQHLYGEADASSDPERLPEEEAWRAEYEELRGVKFHLDQRPKQRPDAAVLDRVLAAAAAASGPPALGARQDRKPQPRHAARRFGLLGTVSTAIAVILIAGIGLYQIQQGGVMQAPSTEAAVGEDARVLADETAPLAEEEASHARDADEPPPIASMTPTEPRPDAGAAAPSGRAMAQPARPLEVHAEGAGFDAAKTEADVLLADDADTEESMPAWDESDEVLRVHRQLEMLETRSPEFAWGDSAVMSLDVLPANPRARDTVTPASTRRGNH